MATHHVAGVPTTQRQRFDEARDRLAEARLQQQRKDTPVNRAAVVARLAEVDAVLDARVDEERRARAGAAHRAVSTGTSAAAAATRSR